MPSSMRSVVPALVMLIVAALLPQMLRAQAGAVVGAVHAQGPDSTGLRDVVVTLTPSDREARTDSSGVFRFATLPAGDYLMSARRLGYDVVFRTFHVAADRETAVRVAMIPLVQRMATITVSGHRVTYPARLEEPYKRAARGVGHFITREQIDSLGPVDLTAVLMRVPGVRAKWNVVEFARCTELGRNNQKVQVWVDGQRWTNYTLDHQVSDPDPEARKQEITLNVTASDVVRDIAPSSVQLIEIFSGPSTIPVDYLNDACAVILIWRK